MIACLAALALLAAPATAAPSAVAPSAAAPGAVDDWQLSGAIGAYRIGVDLLVENGQVESGHYFYDTQLKDIALQPRTSGASGVTLAGADGSTFHLHFIGAGGGTGFANSTGLEGSWTQGSKTLPVRLSLDGASGGGRPGHRYALITDAPDSVVEGKARQFLQAVQHGDRAAAASAVSYPLRVNMGANRHLTIKDRAAFLARYDAIFTPAYLAVLKTAVPHDMFVRDEGAMVASGAAWFDDKGAASLNLDVKP